MCLRLQLANGMACFGWNSYLHIIKKSTGCTRSPKTLDMASDDCWWVLSLGGWMWYMTHCTHRLRTYPSISILYQLHTGRCLIHTLIQKSTTVSSLTWKYMLSLFSFLLCTNITVDLLFSAKQGVKRCRRWLPAGLFNIIIWKPMC